MLNLYQPPAPAFSTVIANAGEYFALEGVGQGVLLEGALPTIPATIFVATNSNILNTLVIQGKVAESDPWVDMATAAVNSLTNYAQAFLIQTLPYMRAGWSRHEAGTSSGVIVRLSASLRELR
jgi:hypothetical protein